MFRFGLRIDSRSIKIRYCILVYIVALHSSAVNCEMSKSSSDRQDKNNGVSVVETGMMLPKCLPYHPLSELSKEPGYYPNINDQQLKCAAELKAIIEKEALDFNTDQEDEFLKLLRFLRARKFNVKLAMDMVREDVRWRAENNRGIIRKQTASEVLNCDLSQFYTYFPVWIQGVDKQQRPVSYRQFGKLEIWNVLKLTSLESLIRFHAWETEQALRLMYESRDKHGYNIETFLLVCDAEGWNLGLATSDAFAFIKGMVVTDADHYPERLGTLLLINAPSALTFAWRIIQGFIDAKTKEKIHIYGSNRSEWLPVLLKYVDEDKIPVQYGGTLPDLTPEEAILSMNPPPPSVVMTTSKSDSSSLPAARAVGVHRAVQTDDGEEYVYSISRSSSASAAKECKKKSSSNSTCTIA